MAAQPPGHGVDLREVGAELGKMSTKFFGTHLPYHLLLFKVSQNIEKTRLLIVGGPTLNGESILPRASKGETLGEL